MGPLDLLTPEPAPLFGGPPARNAYVELHNLIAAAGGPDEFGPRDRDRISRRWGVDLAASFLGERLALYQTVLDDRLSAGALGGADRDLLAHVADTLGLSPSDLRPAHERAFGRAVEDALADDRLDVRERLLLYTLQHTLALDPRLADGAYDVYARGRVVKAVAAALADGEVSPEESEAVERLQRDLSTDAPPRVRALLDEAAALWRARHTPLREGPVGIDLAEGETGHLRLANARWRDVDGSRLVAASDRHRRALETGRTAGLRVPEAALLGRTDVGAVVVTDRRTVLLPARGGRVETPHYALADVFEFANGVVVRTTGGRSTLLDLGDDAVRFAAVARRLRRPSGRPAPPEPEPARDDGPAQLRVPAAAWRDVDGRTLRSVPGMEWAMANGETAGLRIKGEALADVPVEGRAVVSDVALTLTSDRGHDRTLARDAMAPPLRFRNGVLVRPFGGGYVLVDAGGQTDALLRALHEILDDVARGSAPHARWRRVLVQEVHAVWSALRRGRRPFWQRLWSPAAPPDLQGTVRALAANPATWDGPGRLAVGGAHLTVRAAGRTSRASLSTVSGVVADGRFLWVRRRRAYDLLVRLETTADADRIRRALLRGGVGGRPAG